MTTHEWTGEPRYRIDRPVMTQQWRSLAYLHWPYDPAHVQRLLPEGLEVDTFDGRAWVGLVPFHMVGIAARFTPPIPYLGTFPETNVRTYVRGPEGPGVWFHSLDVTRLLPVVVARLTYRLPYVWAKMSIDISGNRIEYRATRRWPGPRGSQSRIVIATGERIAHPEPFDHFLSARWGLYTMLGSRLAHARVEHEPWPLHRADALTVVDDLMEAAGYAAPQGTPHVLYSPGVAVRIERPRFVGASVRR
jgi:uncharacterized protein YqjF (DUF2071 family)